MGLPDKKRGGKYMKKGVKVHEKGGEMTVKRWYDDVKGEGCVA